MGNDINCICFRNQKEDSKKEYIIDNIDYHEENHSFNYNKNQDNNEFNIEKKGTNLNTNSIIIIQNNYQNQNSDNDNNNQNLINIVKNNQDMLKTLVNINSPDEKMDKNIPTIIISKPEVISDNLNSNFSSFNQKDNYQNNKDNYINNESMNNNYKEKEYHKDLKSQRSKKSNKSSCIKFANKDIEENDLQNIKSLKNKKHYTQSIKNVSESFSKKFDRFKSEPYEVVVTFFGKSNTGKSSIISRMCKNTFDTYHIPTIKVETFSFNIKYNQKSFKINLIDTCGLDEYMSDSKELLKYTDYVCYIADLTDPRSFSYIESLFSDHIKCSKNNTLKYFIIGNKSDLSKSLNKKSYKEISENLNIELIEVSALNSINISKITKSILESVIEYIK